ncbi:hypothetical protein E2C01_066791 [Portunus trituberculatus]|uniref:Uncharacterized protein n=1 Tax=Portunus trituberculatus TaxID=210409 RepID=A0A5B7HMH2_PORTR|nr:hypothetical protein [Portunus trituberculatus]
MEPSHSMNGHSLLPQLFPGKILEALRALNQVFGIATADTLEKVEARPYLVKPCLMLLKQEGSDRVPAGLPHTILKAFRSNAWWKDDREGPRNLPPRRTSLGLVLGSLNESESVQGRLTSVLRHEKGTSVESLGLSRYKSSCEFKQGFSMRVSMASITVVAEIVVEVGEVRRGVRA